MEFSLFVVVAILGLVLLASLPGKESFSFGGFFKSVANVAVNNVAKPVANVAVNNVAKPVAGVAVGVAGKVEGVWDDKVLPGLKNVKKVVLPIALGAPQLALGAISGGKKPPSDLKARGCNVYAAGGCKAHYQRRQEQSDGSWRCPEGYTDTGCNWNHGSDWGELQCAKCLCRPTIGGCSNGTYTMRTWNGSGWGCPKGYKDTHCTWGHGVYERKQCVKC